MFYFWSIYLISFFIWDNLILLLYPKSFPNLDVSMLDVLKQVRLANIFLKSNTTIYSINPSSSSRQSWADLKLQAWVLFVYKFNK